MNDKEIKELEKHWKAIKEITGEQRDGTLMLHIDKISKNLLAFGFNIEGIYVEGNNSVVATASKNGITLFSNEKIKIPFVTEESNDQR